MLSVEIDGIVYNNVSSITPSVEYEYYYEVRTMDGKNHRSIKGSRTNYNIVFVNADYEEYAKLKRMLYLAETVRLAVENENNEKIQAEYHVIFEGDTYKGKTFGDQNYYTLLNVGFRRVGFDNVRE
jgi:hypothetical protein